MRFCLWLLFLVVSAVDGRCQLGKAYKGRGIPSSTNLPNAKACQKTCSQNQYCQYFSYDLGDCYLLRESTGLETKATAVSGGKFCVLSQDLVPNVEDQESEEETSQRIHEMVAKIAKYVKENSKNVETVGLATHVKWSAEEGFLKEEGYDKVASILTSGSMLLSGPTNTGGFTWAASEGMMPTRTDLDWLLKHCTGETPISEEIPSEEMLPTGGDTPCNSLRACDTGKSYGAGTPWTNAEVKYCFDMNIASGAREATECAIAKIRQALPGIIFTNVGTSGNGACTTKPAIFVQSSDQGCWANVGMVPSFFGFGGSQKLNLQTPGCNDCGTATHEMLHSMGMAHEQSRPDRDQYIVINWQNIRSGMENQFHKDANADLHRPYDILSIMHYGSTAFTSNGGPTIQAKPQGYELYTTNPGEYRYFRMGQRMGMSERDISQLSDLYQCITPSQCGGVQRPDNGAGAGGGVNPNPNPIGPIGPTIPSTGTKFVIPGLNFEITSDQLPLLVAGAVGLCVLCTFLSCLCSCLGGGSSRPRYVRTQVRY